MTEKFAADEALPLEDVSEVESTRYKNIETEVRVIDDRKTAIKKGEAEYHWQNIWEKESGEKDSDVREIREKTTEYIQTTLEKEISSLSFS